jgi:hypothetical protein
LFWLVPKKKVYAHQIPHPFLTACGTSDILTALAVPPSGKPLFINQLIDTIQSLFYNRRRAAGEAGETQPTDIN